MNKIIKTINPTITKGEGEKKGLYLFVISDGLMDRHGDTVNPDGWDFAEFNKNPVALVGHDLGSLPVGKWLPPFVEDGQVKAYLDIANTERAKEVRMLLEGDYLKTVSVQFRVKKWGGNGDQYSMMQQELYEVSLVSVPANTRAQIVKSAEAIQAFENIDTAIEEVKKHEAQKTLTEDDIKTIVKSLLDEHVKGLDNKVIEAQKKVDEDIKKADSSNIQFLLQLKESLEGVKKNASKAENKLLALRDYLNVTHSVGGGDNK